MIKNYSHRLAALLVALLTTVASMAAGITLNLRKVTVKKAMERIENVSNVRFFYKDNLKDLNKVVTLKTQDASVEKCLELLFAQTDISYKIDKNNVVILQRKGTTSVIADADEPMGNSRTRITGTVTDSHGEPLIGANVKIRGQKTGVVTDIDGHFQLNAATNDVIEVSYIGFSPITTKVGAKHNLTLALTEERNELNEVVVVGYGTQKKVNLTGAVAVIDSKETQGRPVASAAQALQGLDPSVNIGINSGKAGSSYSIDIRGAASLNGSEPLVLVDGIEMSLSRLNPNDIESVSILTIVR